MVVREKVEKQEISWLRKGLILKIPTSIDTQETLRNGATVIDVYEGVLFEDNFDFSPFQRNCQKIFLPGKQMNEKRIETVEREKTFLLNFFRDTIRRDIDYKLDFKAEKWMETEKEDGVEEYLKLEKGGFFGKI